MKKFFKIFGITLASLVGLVLLVVCIACYVVFTPKQLTPIVNRVADSLLTCPHELEEVNLTFFRTFPHFGVEIKGLYVINPKEGAQSDTVLAAPDVLVSVQLFEAIKGDVHIQHCHLNDVEANIYIAPDGTNNFDVLNLPETEDDPNDTVPGWQLRSLAWEEAITVNARSLSFVDDKDTITASMADVALGIADLRKGDWQGACLDLHAEQIDVNLKGEQYTNDLVLTLHLPALMANGTERVLIDGTKLNLNEFALALDGEVGTPCFDSGIYNCDLSLKTEAWQIKPLLALVPAQFTAGLKDIDIDGNIQLEATAKGTYGENQMPLITAHVLLNDGAGAYKPLPYALRDLAVDADASINLNDKKANSVKINSLKAKTKNTRVSAKGNVTELLADMLLDLQLSLDANIPDFAYFIPETIKIDGKAKGNVSAKIRLSHLTDMKLEKGHFGGKLTLSDMNILMDSMAVVLPKTDFAFKIPNAKPSWKKLDWLDMTFNLASVDFSDPGIGKVNLGASDLRLELGNVLKTMPVLYANVDLQSAQRLVADMDSITANIEAPHITAYTEYDTKDTTRIPIFNGKVAFNDLKATYTNINAHLRKSELEAKLTGGNRLHSTPVLAASIKSDAFTANAAEDIKLDTKQFAIEAKARYNARGNNFLLKWNPILHFDMNKAEIDWVEFPQHISVPQMTFDYSNRDFKIATSQIRLGNSDFSLVGEVQNIGRWLQKRDTLTGELNFVSEHTDVNQLMELFSADAGSEEQPAPETAPAETASATPAPAPAGGEAAESSGPFLVPPMVDLVLNTKIKEAKVFNETAYNLGGKVYVRNNTLVLEEMGFVCNAAKLQLTAMYRTPRRNHIYLGLDYHMLDVDIAALIGMIPQLDTMVPMLKSFAGKAEFHLAAETYLNQNYEIKPSTIRGACSLFGKDLVLLDSETFDKISKILMFKKKTENRVDSISAEMTLYKKEIDIYPFCVSLDNYMAAVGGRHNLDMSFNYHVNLLSPLYIGVDVSGTLDDLKIKPAKCVYAQDFKPLFHNNVDTQTAELRQLIRESMRKNVKIQ